MDPFTMSLLASAVSGGVGAAFQGMGQGSPGSTGYDIVNFNDPYDETSRRMASAYLQDMISAMRAGQTPDWLNRFAAGQQQDMQRTNRDQFFGKEGQTGGSVMDMAMSAGAAQGVGGGAASAPVNKALSDYADRMSGINQYISTLKGNYMTSQSQAAPTQLYNMGKRDNSIIGIQQPGSGDDPLMQAVMPALGKIDWTKFGQPQQQQVGTTGQYPAQPNPTTSTYVPGVGNSGNAALNSLFPLTGQYGR
jgi:hypothetical protein